MIMDIEKLYERFPIMQRLKNGVFYAESDDEGKCFLVDGCDECFSIEISKDEAKEISYFFNELSTL